MDDLSVKRTVLIEGMNIEFPIINQHYHGYKSRYLYLSCRVQGNDLPEIEGDRDNAFFTGLVKFDQKTNKIIEKISFGPTHSGGEVFYQQRDGSDPLKDEDDGYLMTTVYDWKTNKSQFVLWDAKTLKVTLKADLDTRVPNGFHGTFVHENDY